MAVVVSVLAPDISIARLVVERAVLPAPEQNADPFERQSPDSGVMGLTICAMLSIVVFGPSRTGNRVQCPFVKGLAQELGAGSTKVNPMLLTAAFYDRGNAAITLNLVRRSVPIPTSAKSSN
jgi:hypothetical protein